MENDTIDQCIDIIPQLEINLSNHTIEEYFYVVKIQNSIVLGMPWVDSLVCFTIDNPNLEICFKHE